MDNSVYDGRLRQLIVRDVEVNVIVRASCVARQFNLITCAWRLSTISQSPAQRLLEMQRETGKDISKRVLHRQAEDHGEIPEPATRCEISLSTD